MLANKAQVTALVKAFHDGIRLTYKKNEFVIRPGETPDSVYYIETGLVKAYNISKYGEENLLIIRKSGEVFPLIWAITGQEREIIYETLMPTTVWRISRDKFLDFLQHHHTSLLPMMDMVVEMYRIHSERIINLEYRTVRERLISFLITMANRFGVSNEKGLVIDVPLKHQDIASSINASRETTSREIAFLERKQLIINEQTLIIIKDLDKLKSFL